MKRLIACLLAAVLLLSMAACKKSGKSEGKVGTVPFTGQELVNNEICLFYVESVAFNALEGYVMTATVKNTQDVPVLMTLKNASLNGCMCDPGWEEYLDAGEEKATVITFPLDKLNNYGITEVTHVEFNLLVCDDETNEQVFLDEQFTIYPLGEKAVKMQQRPSQETDVVLLDNEYCKVVAIGSDPESIFGYELFLYVVNKTDRRLLLNADNEKINGIDCDAFWVDSNVAAGKCSISTVYWMKNRMEAAGITSVDSISFALLGDHQYVMQGELFNQTVTVDP